MALHLLVSQSPDKYSAVDSHWVMWICLCCLRSRPIWTPHNDVILHCRNKPEYSPHTARSHWAGDISHCRRLLYHLWQQQDFDNFTVHFIWHWSTSINWDYTTMKADQVIMSGRAKNVRLSTTSRPLTWTNQLPSRLDKHCSIEHQS